MSSAARRAARATREAANDVARDRPGATRRAFIRRTKPSLAVELSDSSLILQGDDLEEGQWVKALRSGSKLRVGDQLVIARVAPHTWQILDVVSDSTPSVGGGTSLGMSLMLGG